MLYIITVSESTAIPATVTLRFKRVSFSPTGQILVNELCMLELGADISVAHSIAPISLATDDDVIRLNADTTHVYCNSMQEVKHSASAQIKKIYRSLGCKLQIIEADISYENPPSDDEYGSFAKTLCDELGSIAGIADNEKKIKDFISRATLPGRQESVGSGMYL